MKIQSAIYIYVVGFALAVLILIVLFIYPTLRDVKATSRNLFNQKEQLMALEQESIEFERFKRQYSAYESNFKTIDRLFIDQQNPVDFIKFLETMAFDSDVFLKIDFLPSFEAKTSTGALFRLSAKGDFTNVVQFLQKIDFGPYFVDIKEVIIQRLIHSEQSTKREVEADISLQAFSSS